MLARARGCISHMFAVHRALSRERPDVVRAIFRMLVESRAATEGGLLAIYPPIGLEPNRNGIQLAIDWALELKIIPHRIAVGALFDDDGAARCLTGGRGLWQALAISRAGMVKWYHRSFPSF